MPIDLMSILQSGKRTISFMCQCVGLMADLTLGTEHLRWLGSGRFVYGYLRRSESCASDFFKSWFLNHPQVVTGKTYRFKISAKVGASGKAEMVEALRKHENSAPNDNERPRAEAGEHPSTELPPLRYVDDYDGWTTFEDPVLFFFAGKGPYVTR